MQVKNIRGGYGMRPYVAVGWRLSERMEQIIKAHAAPGGCIISFVDPLYSVGRGGYHPVEVSIGRDGRIRYITDFCFVGSPPFEELVKCLDFDFCHGELCNMGVVTALEQEQELFGLWMNNFCNYYDMAVLKVCVSQ